MEGSAFFITAVFLLGASVGGLLASLQRQCTMDRIRSEFNRELALVVDDASAADQSDRRTVPDTTQRAELVGEDELLEDVADEAFFGEHLPVPPRGGNQPHAGV